MAINKDEVVNAVKSKNGAKKISLVLFMILFVRLFGFGIGNVVSSIGNLFFALTT
jgi:hypothetical protein